MLRVERMKAGEKTYRLYACRRCAQQVRICCDCDHGNQYCADDCAPIRRRESLCRAGARYQLSYRGAHRHAARQRAWRSRQLQKVTHQGSLPGTDALILAAIPTTTEEPHVNLASMPPTALPRRLPCQLPAVERCSFCCRALPSFARLGPLRGVP